MKNKAWQQDVITLLDCTHIAFLSTQGKSGPECSMAPYAIHDGNILVHLSSLAKHSQNISNSPEVGLMICTPESVDFSPLALPRLSFQGRVEQVSVHGLQAAKTAYLTKIPEAEPLFSFTDFTLYQYHMQQVYWIGGFGQARKMSLDTWRKVCCPT